VSEDILVKATEGNVRTLRLNRPERANALSRELLARLVDELVAPNLIPASGRSCSLEQERPSARAPT
jgi:hypothetical protein